MIKTFRGKLEDGGQDQIHLAGGADNIGYKIHKLQIMMEQPGNTAQESLVKIYNVKQTSVPTSAATVDFSDDTLVAAAYQDTNVHPTEVIIADQEVFNQDLYITYTDNGSGTNEDINYYLELEEVKLKDSEAAVINYKAALLHGE
jgi:hypothetical protein